MYLFCLLRVVLIRISFSSSIVGHQWIADMFQKYHSTYNYCYYSELHSCYYNFSFIYLNSLSTLLFNLLSRELWMTSNSTHYCCLASDIYDSLGVGAQVLLVLPLHDSPPTWANSPCSGEASWTSLSCVKLSQVLLPPLGIYFIYTNHLSCFSSWLMYLLYLHKTRLMLFLPALELRAVNSLMFLALNLYRVTSLPYKSANVNCCLH